MIFEGFRAARIATSGVTIHVVRGGQGPPVLLLHGYPQTHAMWHRVAPVLAREFTVVAPDLRGYGESDKPAGVKAYDLTELVADVAGLVAAFGARDAVVVAHDWGGGIAWQLATYHPALVKRLVVMNCPHLALFERVVRSHPRQALKSWYMLFFQIPWLPETLLGLGHAWAVGNAIRQAAVQKSAITDDDLRVLRDAASRPGALRSAINYYRAVFRSDDVTANLPVPLRRFLYGDRAVPPARRELEDWPKITAPTMVIWGEQDIALEKALTYGMAPLFATPPRMEYIPDAGHWVQQEKPDEVNRLLLDFLGDLVAPPVRSVADGGPR
jgi:pimeloyl-ACP methyl ester carboxylesterase